MRPWVLKELLSQSKFGSTWKVSSPEGEPYVAKTIQSTTKNPLPEEMLREIVFTYALRGEPSNVRYVDSGFGQVFPDQHLMNFKSQQAGTKETKKRKRTKQENRDVILILPEYSHDLFEEIASRTGLTESKKVGFFLDLLCALKTLHQHHILYVDMKPENTLINRNNRAILADFGLSVPMEWVSHQCEGGTPGYQAPENLFKRAHACTVASDIWTLGATTWTLFFGTSLSSINPEEDPILAKLIQSEFKLPINPEVLSVLMNYFGIAAFLGRSPSPEWIQQWVSNDWQPFVNKITQDMKTRQHPLQKLAQERYVLTRMGKSQSFLSQLVRDLVLPMMLPFDPSARASLDAITKKFWELAHSFLSTPEKDIVDWEARYSWCNVKKQEKQSPVILKEIKGSSSFTDKEKLLKDLHTLFYERKPSSILKERLEKEHIAAANTLYQQYMHILKREPPDAVKTLVFIVALWLTLYDYLDISNMPLSAFCNSMKQTTKGDLISCPPEQLVHITSKILSHFLDILAKPYAVSSK